MLVFNKMKKVMNFSKKLMAFGSVLAQVIKVQGFACNHQTSTCIFEEEDEYSACLSPAWTACHQIVPGAKKERKEEPSTNNKKQKHNTSTSQPRGKRMRCLRRRQPTFTKGRQMRASSTPTVPSMIWYLPLKFPISPSPWCCGYRRFKI